MLCCGRGYFRFLLRPWSHCALTKAWVFPCVIAGSFSRLSPQSLHLRPFSATPVGPSIKQSGRRILRRSSWRLLNLPSNHLLWPMLSRQSRYSRGTSFSQMIHSLLKVTSTRSNRWCELFADRGRRRATRHRTRYMAHLFRERTQRTKWKSSYFFTKEVADHKQPKASSSSTATTKLTFEAILISLIP